ncbi:MAG: amidase family protein [Alphaproteobacteria bacterium]|jgi:amidase|nr:amidase family protein [Alphaproteobacteria bacterium]MBT4964651.1 amidase family protein [Alphaproteobacteria bacterium]MBT5919318.1 amidase family protein [Alphaproteobacteria bacterium]MBT6384257.1 amidase family protein [Alphaproteobacteria bacterium]
MAKELWQLGAVETAAKIAAGEISASHVTEAHLTRMASVNPALNAVTNDLSVSARVAAIEADQAQAAGDDLGLMHGVPMTIKENVDQAGCTTPNGIVALNEAVATSDSPVVANVKDAGAVILGRTNTPEFSFRWFTDNDLHGQTLNPWDKSLTPGGSSGGAAASLAAGVGCLAHGNDLGGSLRYPAYCCGLATIRPSLGRVAAYNASAPEERTPSQQQMSVQGPIGRSVADVRLGLEVMAQADWRDPWQAPEAMLLDMPATPIRVAVSADPIGVGVDPAVAEAVWQAASWLSSAGYEIVEVDPPEAARIAEDWRKLIFTEADQLLISAVDNMASQNCRQVFADYISCVDLLDMPGYMRTLADRTRQRRLWAAFMQENPLLLMPVSGEKPMPQHDDLQGQTRLKTMLDAQAPMYIINHLGLPAAAVPTGLVDGVPMGVQIVGQSFREGLCLDAAQVIENHVGILAEQLWARED